MKHLISLKKLQNRVPCCLEWTAILAFALITAACSDDSTTNSPNAQACGNGVQDEGEICDGTRLSQEVACPEGMQLPSGAKFSCNADCSLNTEACVPIEVPDLCGNENLDDGEICDGELSKEASCPEGTHLPTDASLSCNADCSLNTDACVPNQEEPVELCGNGSLDEDEVCDGELISKFASCPEGMHVGEGKAFACNADCTLDTSACEIDASTTIPQGRVQADEANPELEAVQLHRTPQDVFPNEALYADREDEPSQIVTQIPVGEVVDIVGAVGDRWRVQYKEFEGYIHSMYIQRINELEIPAIDYASVPSPNYYQLDPQWKGVVIHDDLKIENYGGIPVTVADAISAIKHDNSYTPGKVVEGLRDNFGKTKDHVCKSVVKAFQLECEYIDNTDGMNCGSNNKKDASVREVAKSKMQDALKNGWYIIAEEGDESSSYWKTNRNVLLYGYDSVNDRVYFDDPRNNHYMFEGIEAFLDCNHSMSIIKDICVPKACADLAPECGELNDGCGGTLNCACTPKGTVLKDDTLYRRSPQNKFPAPDYTDGLLNTTHTSGLTAPNTSELPQIAGKLAKGTEVDIIGKVRATSMTPEWYQVSVDGKNYYILASDLKTNGVEADLLPYFSGATNNYAQGDSRWATAISYGTGNMHSDGCGPSSMANALSTLLNNDKITPLTIAKEYKNNGASNTSGGGTWADARLCNIPTIANNNISCVVESKANDTKDKMINTLKAGGYVIVLHQTACYWTNVGHYITVYGYDGTHFFADDPMGRKYHQNADDFMKTTIVVAHVNKK